MLDAEYELAGLDMHILIPVETRAASWVRTKGAYC